LRDKVAAPDAIAIGPIVIMSQDARTATAIKGARINTFNRAALP
jgi:hypothetical protein